MLVWVHYDMITKQNNISLFIALIGILLAVQLSGCYKYPEGPKFSLLTKRSRMVNHWQLKLAKANGESWTPFFPLKEIELFDDNNQISTFSTLNVETELEGQWEFVNQKEELKLIYANGQSQSYRITKLKKDELNIYYNSNDTLYKLEYETYK